MINYPWPGNVRELQHAVERAVILSDSKVLEATNFIVNIGQLSTDMKATNSIDMKSIEKSAIKNALDNSKGNLTNASKELGMGRTTLYRKMKKYQL